MLENRCVFAEAARKPCSAGAHPSPCGRVETPLPLLPNTPTPALISLLHVHPVNLHGGKREEEKKEEERRKRCAAFAHLKTLQKPDMFGNVL